MKLFFKILLIWVFGSLGLWVFADDTAHIVVSAQDNWSRNLNNRQILLVPIAPLSRTISTNIFARDVRRLTVTNGVCIFSNTVWGYYRMEISGTPFTAFDLLLGTNHSGLVSAAALVTNSAALPPDPATNYYTMSQVDALLAGLGGGGGGGSGSNSVWLMSGTNISITSVTNLGTITFTIYGDVSHQEVSNSTNGLATAIIARMTDATNDLGTVLITRIANATNDIYGVLLTRITDATNTLNTTLSTKITNATNDLATALIARITASTNSGNIAFVTGAAKTIGAYDASSTTNLNATELRSGTVADARLSANVSLLGSSVSESELSLSDVTTANASTSAHGFLKKLSGTSTEYLDGSGNFSTPAGGGGSPVTFNPNQFGSSASGTNILNGAPVTNMVNRVDDETVFLKDTTGNPLMSWDSDNGDLKFFGNIVAAGGGFVGHGGSITNMNASQLTTGQVPNGRITQSNSYNGSFTGSGPGITNLIATNISSTFSLGTIAGGFSSNSFWLGQNAVLISENFNYSAIDPRWASSSFLGGLATANLGYQAGMNGIYRVGSYPTNTGSYSELRSTSSIYLSNRLCMDVGFQVVGYELTEHVVGAVNSTTVLAATDAIRWIGNTNWSANWIANCTSNSVATFVTSSVPVTLNSVIRLSIDADTTSARFYTNGVIATTISTNIPVGRIISPIIRSMAVSASGSSTIQYNYTDYLWLIFY